MAMSTLEVAEVFVPIPEGGRRIIGLGCGVTLAAMAASGFVACGMASLAGPRTDLLSPDLLDQGKGRRVPLAPSTRPLSELDADVFRNTPDSSFSLPDTMSLTTPDPTLPWPSYSPDEEPETDLTEDEKRMKMEEYAEYEEMLDAFEADKKRMVEMEAYEEIDAYEAKQKRIEEGLAISRTGEGAPQK